MSAGQADDWKEELRRTIQEALQVAAVEVAKCVRRDVREELLRAFRSSPPVLQTSYSSCDDVPRQGWVASESSGTGEDTPGTDIFTPQTSPPTLAKATSSKCVGEPSAKSSRFSPATETQAEFAMLFAPGDLDPYAKDFVVGDQSNKELISREKSLDLLDVGSVPEDMWEDSSKRGYMASKAIRNYPLADEVIIRSASRKLSRDSQQMKEQVKLARGESEIKRSSRKSDASSRRGKSGKKSTSSFFKVFPNGSQPMTPRSDSGISSATDDPNLLFMDRFAVTHMATAAPRGSEVSAAPFVSETKMERDDSTSRGGSEYTSASRGVERMESLFPRLKPGLTKAMHRQVTTVVSGTSKGMSRCYIRVASFVTNQWFDYAISILLLLNALAIGAQVDYMARNQLTQVPVVFVVLGWFFVSCFTMELVLRLFVHRSRFFYMPGWQWNVFDAIVVTLQLLEELMATIVDTVLGELYANFTVARLLRSVRLVRVVRFVRIVRLIRELRCMVASIAGSLRTFLWTIALLLLMIYIIGVYITQLVVDHRISSQEEGIDPQLTRYFGSLGDSVLSLFQAMSGGVDWDDLVAPLRNQISPMMAIVFAIYIAFATFVMLNLVTGIFVESAHASIKEDKDLDLVNRVRELFITADDDRSGCITWEEFKKHVGSPHMEEYFRSIDLDLSEAKSFFSLLDTNGNGKITSEDFLNGCLRLRGTARAIDLTTLVHNMKRMYKQWLNSTKRIERHIVHVSKSLTTLTSVG